MSKKTIVTWDLGATKCAVALISYDSDTRHFTCEKSCFIKLIDCHSLFQLTQVIEQQLSIKIQHADAVCIGAAGMFDGEMMHLEAGYPYAMPIGTLAKELGWQNYAVVHDYVPIVCGSFQADINNPAQVKKLNTAPLNPLGRRVALGVGTGLGLKDGVLFADGGFWLGTNEMGHIAIGCPPLVDTIYYQRHQALMTFLQQREALCVNKSLTYEKILSGKGTARLHQFLHPEQPLRSPEEVGQLMRAGKAPETLALFAWYLGLFIGTVQLSFMPDGGVWITGGVILNHLDVFNHAEFWQGIEATPAYLPQRRQFPLVVPCHPQHAFMGAAYYAVQRLLNL